MQKHLCGVCRNQHRCEIKIYFSLHFGALNYWWSHGPFIPLPWEAHVRSMWPSQFRSPQSSIWFIFFQSGLEEAIEDDIRNPPSFPLPYPVSARLIWAQLSELVAASRPQSALIPFLFEPACLRKAERYTQNVKNVIPTKKNHAADDYFAIFKWRSFEFCPVYGPI